MWEYAVLTFATNVIFDYIEQELNEFGAEEWELVSHSLVAAYSETQHHHVFVFKRRQA